MRICYVGNLNAVHTQRWAVHFARAGHEVHVAYAAASSRSIRLLEDASVSVHLLSRGGSSARASRDTVDNAPAAVDGPLRGSWQSMYARLPPTVQRVVFFYGLQSLRLRRVLEEIRPDIVHAWFLPDSGCLAALTRFRPLVVSSWGSDVTLEGWHGSTALASWANRFSIRRADRVTATSEWLAAETRRFASAETPIHVVPFGIDCEVFTPRKRASGDVIRIGFAKHLMRRYGPDTLLHAVSKLAPAYPSLEVHLAGDGEMHSELQAMADRLGIGSRVRFLGDIPHTRMADFLSGLDIAVQPSRHRNESFGVAGLEASAMGLPVVATRVGGVPETILHGRTGLLVPPDCPNAMAEALGRLIADPGLRERLGQEGRRWVLHRYEWGHCTHRMERIYEGVLGRWHTKLESVSTERTDRPTPT